MKRFRSSWIQVRVIRKVTLLPLDWLDFPALRLYSQAVAPWGGECGCWQLQVLL